MDVMLYYNKPEVITREQRKRKFITLAESLKNYLDYLYKTLNIEDYSFSYLVEDLIFYLVTKEELLKDFIKENYDLEGEEVKILPPPKEWVKTVENEIKDFYEKGGKEDAEI